MNWTNAENKKGQPTGYPIAYVNYRNGTLIRIECLLNNTWLIQLLNGLIRVTRNRPITAIEKVKVLAEQMLRSGIKEVIIENDIQI